MYVHGIKVCPHLVSVFFGFMLCFWYVLMFLLKHVAVFVHSLCSAGSHCMNLPRLIYALYGSSAFGIFFSSGLLQAVLLWSILNFSFGASVHAFPLGILSRSRWVRSMHTLSRDSQLVLQIGFTNLLPKKCLRTPVTLCLINTCFFSLSNFSHSHGWWEWILNHTHT